VFPQLDTFFIEMYTTGATCGSETVYPFGIHPPVLVVFVLPDL